VSLIHYAEALTYTCTYIVEAIFGRKKMFALSQFCITKGGQLVEIWTEEKQKEVNKFADLFDKNASTGPQEYWIGRVAFSRTQSYVFCFYNVNASVVVDVSVFQRSRKYFGFAKRVIPTYFQWRLYLHTYILSMDMIPMYILSIEVILSLEAILSMDALHIPTYYKFF
jgi:hypothetical protein